MHSIYKITNIVTNKIYIGQTSKTLDERFSSHVKCAQRKVNRYLYDSMNHHGIENFKIELVEVVDEKEIADEREKYWISHLTTMTPNGYNMTIGGGGGNTLAAYSEEKRAELYKQQANARRGQKRSEETKRKISESKIGKPMSEDSKDNLSRSMKEQYASGKRKITIPESRYGSDHHDWVDMNEDELLTLIKDGYTIGVISSYYKCSKPTVITRIQKYFNKTYTELRREYGITQRKKTLE